MQEWYIPITILPGICLLILSTSNIMLDLSREIKMLIGEQEQEHDFESRLIERKLKQLKLVNRAMVFLYVSIAFFIISALISGISNQLEVHFNGSVYTLIIAVLSAFLAITSLMLYSFRAVRLRQDQYHRKC